MATVINLPQYESLGASLGKGLGGAFEVLDKKKKEEALREWAAKVQHATTPEEYYSIPVPEGALEDVNDIQKYYEIAASRFPDSQTKYDLFDVFDKDGNKTQIKAPKDNPPSQEDLLQKGFTYQTPQEKTQWYMDTPKLTPSVEQPTRPAKHLTMQEWKSKYVDRVNATKTSGEDKPREFEVKADAIVQQMGLPATPENRKRALFIQQAAPVSDAHIEKVYAQNFGAEFSFGSKAEQVSRAKEIARQELWDKGGDPIAVAKRAIAQANSELSSNDQVAVPPPEKTKGSGVISNVLNAIFGGDQGPKYAEGTELVGPDGKVYVVKNGEPVLKEGQ